VIESDRSMAVSPAGDRLFGSAGAPGQHHVHHSRVYLGAKRLVDVVFASVLLVLCLPVLLVSAIFVKASGLPLLFRQERVGKHGKLFTVYKLDTMRRADFQICTHWEDNRVPKACRWLRTCRIDELPQLWNILRGDMSLVGPRPLPLSVVEEARATRSGYSIRELVTPGLTSWAKVRQPNGQFSVNEQMLEDDIYSIQRASLLFEARVLLMTPYAVWRGLTHFRAARRVVPEAAQAAQAG
jgi:lipopolysaccharide/colanic/teichoic acid biosynthesis glycosyltransferase